MSRVQIHFHGGIDIRTEQVEGKPIFSVADGYVSRITVGLDGFGYAVYVNHPGGKTSVYCHLKNVYTAAWCYCAEMAISKPKLFC